MSYLDFISPISGVTPEASENVLGIEIAFSLGSLLDAMNIQPEKFFKQTDFDFKNIDFIMVDNISNLVNFATVEKLKQFIDNLIQIINKLTVVYGIVIMDDKTDDEIRQIIEPYFDRAVAIKDDWL